MIRRFILAAIFIATLPLAAFAQSGGPVKQNGNVTPGHSVVWTSNGTIQDAGSATAGLLTELGVTKNGGCGIGINQFPLSQSFNQMCFGVDSVGGYFNIQNFGGLTLPSLRFIVNGTTFPLIPGSGYAGLGPNTFTGTQTAPSFVSTTNGLMTGLNVINVVDQLELKCDNATDNASVFTALHGKTSGHPGFFIYFPPQAANCLTSQPMTFDSGTTYWAAPNTVTIKPTTGSTASPILLGAFTNFSSNVYIYGLTFDGALSSTQTNASTLLQAFNGTNLVFDNITVQNTRGIGILFSYQTVGMINSGVRNAHFNNVGNFWTFSGVSTNRQQAIAFTGASPGIAYGNFSVNNWFNNTGLDDVSVTHQNDFLATGNHCFAPAYQFPTLITSAYNACVFVSTSNNAVVSNNISIGMSGNSFDIVGQTPTLGQGIVVSNNISIGAGQAGISINGTNGAVVTGNVLTNGNQLGGGNVLRGGLTIAGTVTNISVSNNTITDLQSVKTQLYGIQYATLPGPIAPVVTNAQIDLSNILVGNATSAFNGGAAYTNPASYQVGTLYNGSGASAIPSCATALAGTLASVSDGKASPAYNSAYVTADGSSTRPVYCDGTGWTYH